MSRHADQLRGAMRRGFAKWARENFEPDVVELTCEAIAEEFGLVDEEWGMDRAVAVRIATAIVEVGRLEG